jgi:hypothetical protein
MRTSWSRPACAVPERIHWLPDGHRASLQWPAEVLKEPSDVDPVNSSTYEAVYQEGTNEQWEPRTPTLFRKRNG